MMRCAVPLSSSPRFARAERRHPSVPRAASSLRSWAPRSRLWVPDRGIFHIVKLWALLRRSVVLLSGGEAEILVGSRGGSDASSRFAVQCLLHGLYSAGPVLSDLRQAGARGGR